MRRLVVRGVALTVLGLLACIPLLGFDFSSGDSGEVTTISSYRADFTVADDGDLTAVETIAVDFPVGSARHGIFRFFDTHDPTDRHVRRIPRDIRVSQDGAPAVVDLSWKNDRRERVLRIGDPDRYVASGTHTYRISYRIDGVVEKGADGSRSQFYWNLVPGGWAQPIGQASLRVRLPADAEGIRCAVGSGATTGCEPSTDGRVVQVSTGALPPRTPVTLKVGLDMATPPSGDRLPWAGRWDGVLGRSVPGLAAAVALAVAAAAAGSLLSRRARERNPAFPLQYAPPDGLGPAQANYLRTERLDRTAYVASVMQAAEKGAITLTRDGSAWTMTDTGRGWQGIDEVTQQVYDVIGSPHGQFTVSKKSAGDGERLKEAIADFDKQTKAWALSSGFLARLGFGGLLGLATLGALVLAVVLVFWRPTGASVWAFVPGGFGIFGSGLLKTGATTVRTRSGRDMWSRIGGFHRVLSTPSSEARFDFAGRQELYTAYLPWAVAFGCADAWAKKYQVETGSAPPTPAYLSAAGGTHAGAVGSMVDSFSSTVDGAISSYEATQSSSSSGGGFSGGGGGGGGGGGSW
jgi:hypothetical protein